MGALLRHVMVRDQAIQERMLLSESAPGLFRLAWSALTHLGGASVTLSVSVVPAWFGGPFEAAARRSFVFLVVSHLLVQLLKRSVSRERPARVGLQGARVPDRFSFPSGHAAAATSVALGFAVVFPAGAVPLLVLAFLVGASRVVLGVHYPADVLTGQGIAVLTALVLAPLVH